MAKTVIINGKVYNDVKEFRAPLASNPSQIVVFPDTSDADAVAESIMNGETAYVNGKKVTGNMPIRNAGGGTITTRDGIVTIPKGYYNGNGNVTISEQEKAKIVAANIRQGVTILGVEGNMSATEGAKAQSKAVTPSETEQVVLPDSGYNYLSQVTVGAIPTEYIKTADATAEADDLKLGETAYVNGKKITGTHTDPTFSLTNGVLTIS